MIPNYRRSFPNLAFLLLVVLPLLGLIGHAPPHLRASGTIKADGLAPPMSLELAPAQVNEPSEESSKEAGIAARQLFSPDGFRGSFMLSRMSSPSPRFKKPRELEILIKKYAGRYQMEEKLVWAVMRQESGFNPWAVSPKGAMGLMQLMPATAALMGVDDPFDVEQNIAGGVKFLKKCLVRFNHDMVLALAAYNAGPENVEKYNGCPPFSETRNYVASVLHEYTGEPWRYAGKNFVRRGPDKEDKEESEQESGLNWKIAKPQVHVPEPQWKIPLPQVKVGSRRQHLQKVAALDEIESDRVKKTRSRGIRRETVAKVRKTGG